MARPLRALLTVALVVPLTVGAAGADEPEPSFGVANSARRQALLHRSWPEDGVPGTVLVTATTPEIAADVAAAEDGAVIGDRIVLLQVDPGDEGATAARIASRYGVLGIEPDRERELAVVPNDADYAEQWSHRLASTEAAWNTTTGDASVQVAVLDTGVDGDHDDLLPNLTEQVDLSSGRLVRRSLGSDNDTCNIGHGTFVAGIVGALGNNSIGVAGVAWEVSIVDVALTSRSSRCGILDSAIIAGLEYVTGADRADGPVDVVNLSLGGVSDTCPTALQAAVDDARAAGTLVIAAAGNDELRIVGATSIPASCDGVMSVGSVGDAGNIAPYSNQNEWIDIAGPGGDSSTGAGIVSTTAGGGYGDEEGTSFAAPYVAGVAALLRSIDPSLTPDDLESILERSATDAGASGRDRQFGWGRINAADAVSLASAGDPDPPASDPSFPVATGGSIVQRIEGSGSTTQAILQAVAMSEATFDADQAFHAVIARGDDFADALAGSALGFGIGPLLFSTSTGPLAGVTAGELQRVLEPGSVVYLLGGTAALPSTLEAQISDLGFTPVRLAGTSRQVTAAAVAERLESFLSSNEFTPPPYAIVATAFNWPDAVSAGALGAWFGIPILLTAHDALEPATAEFLRARDWAGVYVVGGTAAISEDVRRAIRDAAGVTSADTKRLAGETRSGTTVAVGTEFERLFSAVFEAAFGEPAVPNVVAAVNLRRADGFAHVLSASALLGSRAGVFVPVEGETGDQIASAAQSYTCRFPAAGVVVGSHDIISQETETLFDLLLKGEAEACTG